MADLLNTFFTIAEKSDLLDKIEKTLRDQNKNILAGLLTKCQQDIGLEIDRLTRGVTTQDVTLGDQTKPLKENFEPLDFQRIDLLFKAIDQQLSDSALKTEFIQLFNGITPKEESAAPKVATKSKPKM